MPAPLSADDVAMLALTLVPGLGPRLTNALLDHFGSATTARAATVQQLLEVPHIGPKLAADFVQALARIDLSTELALLEHHGVSLAILGQNHYPPPLAAIADAPRLIYYRGTLTPADYKAVAIVGSRQCTTYGKKMAERLAAGLARTGYTVISGLARGIDGSAHEGALSASGRTIAVMAGGLSSIYPPDHSELADRVAGSGALVTETPMAMQPQRGMFHARNRLISGLARAVVVIEANDRSGALITARHAGEQGRDLFALPANVDSMTSAGSLKLLRDGARLIRDLDDLLEDLEGIPAQDLSAKTDHVPVPPSLFPAVPDLPEGELRIWEALDESRPIDDLSRRLDLPIAELSRLLMTLELKKVIKRLPGNFYERRS